MLVARSQEGSVSSAVATTFDGDHPCPLCAAISDVREKEQKEAPEAPALKNTREIKFVELVCFALPESAVAGEMRWPEFVTSALVRTDVPPTPPPLA